MPPLCNSLYEGPCTRNVCNFYHPQVNHSVLENFQTSHHRNSKIVTEWSAEISSAPNALIKTAVGTTSGSLLSVLRSLFFVNHSQVLQGEGIASVKQEPSVPLRGGIDCQPATPSSNQTLSSSTSSTHRMDANPHRLQCPAWNDGYCPEGKDCKMLHLGRVILLHCRPLKQFAHTSEK